jgi:hypothetical protein
VATVPDVSEVNSASIFKVTLVSKQLALLLTSTQSKDPAAESAITMNHHENLKPEIQYVYYFLETMM